MDCLSTVDKLGKKVHDSFFIQLSHDVEKSLMAIRVKNHLTSGRYNGSHDHSG